MYRIAKYSRSCMWNGESVSQGLSASDAMMLLDRLEQARRLAGYRVTRSTARIDVKDNTIADAWTYQIEVEK